MRFAYIPEYHCSLDKINSGYIIHGQFDLEDDYVRNENVDERLAKVKKLVFDDNYEPLYENWHSLHFPLLHNVSFGGVHSKCSKFDDLPNEVLQMAVKAEKHLFVDVKFEKYVESLGLVPSELDTINKLNLVENFKFFNGI
jgi:hypothetical protein